MSKKNLIGYPKAETEIDADIFEKNFLKTRFFEEANDSICTYICGRKGTGKTAILKQIINQKTKNGEFKYKYRVEIENYDFYKNFALNFSPEIINPYADYTSSIREKFDVSNYFTLLWQFLITVQMMNEVVKENDEPPKIIGDYLNINKYINIDIFQLAEKIIKDSIDVYGKNGSEFGPWRALSVINEKLMNSLFLDAKKELKELLKKNKCIIGIDTLEDYFISEEVCLKAINGMMNAINLIRKDFNINNLSIKCCLPGEMFARLSLPNPAQIDSSTTFLLWRVSDLIRLIGKRYYNLLNEKKKVTATNQIDWDNDSKNKILEEFFWKHFPMKLKNRQGFFESTLGHINRHTFKKPREYIEIFQSIINIAEENDISQINDDCVIKGTHEAIDVLVKDNTEAYGQIHGIENTNTFSKEIFLTLPRIFKLSELKKVVKAKKHLIQSGSLLDHEVIRILIEIGFIGILTKRTSEVPPYYCEAEFEYLTKGTLPVNNNLNYVLHPSIYDYIHINPDRGELICIYPKPSYIFDEDFETLPRY